MVVLEELEKGLEDLDKFFDELDKCLGIGKCLEDLEGKRFL